MTYPGGKNGSGVYHAIINEMPKHRVYIEPFLGSGAILRHKRPADTSWACEWHEEQFRAFGGSEDFRPAVTLAEALTVTDQRTFYDPVTLVPRLHLRHVDALKFLREFVFQGERDHYLVYMDPPYLMEMRSSTKSRCYTKDFSTWFEHEELLALAVSLNANVMISGYDHPLYNARLDGWRKKEFTGQTRGGPRTECLWMNYAEPRELHDYRYLGRDYREREDIRRQQKRWTAKLAGMTPHKRYALLAAIENYLDGCRDHTPPPSADNGDNAGAIVVSGLTPEKPEWFEDRRYYGDAIRVDANQLPGENLETCAVCLHLKFVHFDADGNQKYCCDGCNGYVAPASTSNGNSAVAVEGTAKAVGEGRPGKTNGRKPTKGELAVACLVENFWPEDDIEFALVQKDPLKTLTKQFSRAVGSSLNGDGDGWSWGTERGRISIWPMKANVVKGVSFGISVENLARKVLDHHSAGAPREAGLNWCKFCPNNKPRRDCGKCQKDIKAAKDLHGKNADAGSRGWLARKDDPVVIQDDGSGNQVTASGRVLR